MVALPAYVMAEAGGPSYSSASSSSGKSTLDWRIKAYLGTAGALFFGGIGALITGVVKQSEAQSELLELAPGKSFAKEVERLRDSNTRQVLYLRSLEMKAIRHLRSRKKH